MPSAPRRPTTKHLYKYGSLAYPDRLRSILLDHSIYYPSAAELNDPTECLPVFAEHSAEEIVAFLTRQYLADHPNATAKELVAIAHNVRHHGTETILREMRGIFDKQLDRRYGILSLSKRFDSFPMWAHYAANHSGYCLEFLNAPYVRAYEVNYQETQPFRLSNDLDEFQANFLYSKRPTWAYEEEVRILMKPPGLYSLPPELLVSVLLGKDANPERIRDVVQWARQRVPAIPVYRLTFDRGLGELRREMLA